MGNGDAANLVGAQKKILPLKTIEVGEPDANAEFFIARRAKEQPMFLRAYYDHNSGITDELSSGRKFLLYGQKGTGKTAILRHLESESSHDYVTEFVIFRKEIVEEAQLASISATFSANIVVDEDKVQETKFYYHAMKRLMLSILLAKLNNIEDEIPDDAGWFKRIYSEVRSSTAGQLASLITDSVIGSIESIRIDLEKLTSGSVKISPAMAVKRSNDAFQKFAFQQFSSKKLRARIFLDEMHFAYRDSQNLGADAALVRDTVLAVREINEKLTESNIDSLIYMSIRSEFLEHQEIAVADVAHTIESYGAEVSWENAAFDRAHPMFEVALQRLKLGLGDQLTRDVMIRRYIPVSDIDSFLEYTWGKPRDIIRFFKAAKATYHNNGSLRTNEYKGVIRRYCQSAWQDVKAALTAFVPKDSIPSLEEALQVISSHNLDGSVKFNKNTLKVYLDSAYQNMKKLGVTYDINELIKLLYIVGVFTIRYRDANEQTIVHSFHRGNRHPAKDGFYIVHRAVARTFS